MYYHTPKMQRYITMLLKYRFAILISYLLFVLFMGMAYTPKFLSSDALFWLKGSKEFKQVQEKKFETQNFSKLTVKVEKFDEATRKSLNALHKALVKTEGVEKVYSLFSNELIKSEQSGESSEMLTVVHAEDVDTLTLKKMLQEEHNSYGNVAEDDLKTFYYFISGKKSIDISKIKIPGTYTYLNNDVEINWYSLDIYIILAIFIAIFIFRLLFRSYTPFIAAFLLISFSTLLTFSFIILLTDIETIHISMLFIAISISLVEFLYFYYRWHVSQYRNNKENALRKMLTRNMPPAMWTSVSTLFGLGSLVFIDSDIIKLLSLSVILSSIIAYILNLTFLPALLSYFKIEHAHVPYVKLGILLTMREIHYNKKFLFLFLGLTYTLLITAIYMMYGESNNFFKLHVQNEQVELKIPYENIDLPFVQSIEKLSEDLKEHFGDGISDIVSISSIVHSLNDSNTQTKVLDEEALEQALFYMDLYNLHDQYFDGSSTNLVINLWDINKVELIEWLLHYKGIDLYFIDNATLVDSAKYNQTLLLASSLFVALLLIGIITGWIFRSKAMIFVGFTINAIPIVWFGLIVTLLAIPLSLEMLIAMSIALGLSSDSNIHFSYKYFRLRYFGRSKKHALEKMYFYAAIPVIISSILLIIVFLTLYLSGVHSLELIGLYSASMVLLSLLADLLILPIMLLYIDKFQKKFKNKRTKTAEIII